MPPAIKLESKTVMIRYPSAMLLPVELVDLIFSFLRGEKSALEACSKAHPMFSRLAEPYLYEDILLTDVEVDDTDGLYNQFCTNPHMLNFPRTLEFKHTAYSRFTNPTPFDIMITQIVSMVPQMVNLTSLTFQGDLFLDSDDQYEKFLLTFGTCLQRSAIEELYLEHFFEFRLSILDNGKNIKTLTLSDFTAMEENEPSSTSGSPAQSLETLIIRSHYSSEVLVWATRRAINLKTLEFQDSISVHDWETIPLLLTACSDSLTKLHFDCAGLAQAVVEAGRWIGDRTLPFTLSNNTHLKELNISAEVYTSTKIHCALPAILHLIKTAPSIQDVVLIFNRGVPSETAPIEPMDLSPLLIDRLRSDFPTSGPVHPHIDLHIDDRWAHPRYQIIPDVLGVRR